MRKFISLKFDAANSYAAYVMHREPDDRSALARLAMLAAICLTVGTWGMVTIYVAIVVL